MSSRAQSAMEYLMTYGWAIMVVLIVGGAFWQLGVFNLGGSVPPTSTGFQALRPLLPTCIMKKGVYLGTYYGFQCQFVNAAGSPIVLRDVTIKVNDQYCVNMFLSNKPTSSGNTWGLQHPCYYDNCSGTSTSCWGTCTSDGGVMLAANQDFMATVFSTSSGVGPCNPSRLKAGDRYSIFVDITYDIAVGDVTTSKHSSGTIYLTSTCC